MSLIDQVQVATTADGTKISQTLSLAFEREPTMNNLFPNIATRQRGLQKFFASMVRADVETGLVLQAPAQQAVSLWRMSDGMQPSLIRRLLQTGSFAVALGWASWRALHIAREIAAHYPSEPHWYLRFLGCRPQDRGQGWGTAVLQAGIIRAAVHGMPIYLETADQGMTSFYERFGFTIRSQYNISGTDLCFWSLFRPADGHRADLQAALTHQPSQT